MIKKRFKSLLLKLVDKQQCASKLSRSFCVGTYIAFSPFVGMHTVLVFLLSWLFSLECAAVFAAAWLINNPWTMLPIYACNYTVGQLFLGSLCGIDTLAYNPTLPVFIQPVATWFAAKTGLVNVSFWSFVVGGNILGLCVALTVYPIVKIFFKQIIKEKNVLPCDSKEVITPQ